MPLQTSAEHPAPLRTISAALGQWVERLGWVWIEAQIAELSRRQSRVFLTLRDTEADLSVQASCTADVLDVVVPPIAAAFITFAQLPLLDGGGSDKGVHS